MKDQGWEDTLGGHCGQKMESAQTAQEGGRVERSIAEIEITRLDDQCAVGSEAEENNLGSPI